MPAVEADAKQIRPEPVLTQIKLQSRTAGLALLGLALVAGALLLIWLLHNAPYVMDEWSLMQRAQGGSPSQILEPWNGHLLAFGLLLAHFSILLVGSSYSLLIALDVAGVLACSALVYVFARRRIGPILALAPAMVPLFFSGSSAFYGTGIQFTPLMGINGIIHLTSAWPPYFSSKARGVAKTLPPASCCVSPSLPFPTASPLSSGQAWQLRSRLKGGAARMSSSFPSRFTASGEFGPASAPGRKWER